jgi:tetratricopeptide (TPR) repeat protein
MVKYITLLTIFFVSCQYDFTEHRNVKAAEAINSANEKAQLNDFKGAYTKLTNIKNVPIELTYTFDVNLSYILAKLGKYDSAIQILEAAYRVNPFDSCVVINYLYCKNKIDSLAMLDKQGLMVRRGENNSTEKEENISEISDNGKVIEQIERMNTAKVDHSSKTSKKQKEEKYW